MNWILQSPGKASEFELTSEDGQIIKFKYSHNQQSIRMRYNEHYGVYLLDDDSFVSRKFAIRNVYGSEIGTLSKGLWRENTGTLFFNEVTDKINYHIDQKQSAIQVFTGIREKDTIAIADGNVDENYMLSLIVYSWVKLIAKAVHSPELI